MSETMPWLGIDRPININIIHLLLRITLWLFISPFDPPRGSEGVVDSLSSNSINFSELGLPPNKIFGK